MIRKFARAFVIWALGYEPAKRSKDWVTFIRYKSGAEEVRSMDFKQVPPEEILVPEIKFEQFIPDKNAVPTPTKIRRFSLTTWDWRKQVALTAR